MYKNAILAGFEDMLTFFSADHLKLCQAEWRLSVYNYFSSLSINVAFFRVWDLNGPLVDIQNCPPKQSYVVLDVCQDNLSQALK